MIFKPARMRTVSLIAAVIFALPLPLGMLTGLYVWTSPFILLNSVFSLKSMVIFNVFGFVFLLLILYRDRWICRYWCPTGVLCDAVSRIARPNTGDRKLPLIHRRLAIVSLILALFGFPVLSLLDPINIFYGFFDFVHSDFAPASLLKASGLLIVLSLSLLFPHSWCNRLCPLLGVQSIIMEIKGAFRNRQRRQIIEFDKNKRYLISGLAAVGVSLAFGRIVQSSVKPGLRPPGALPGNKFKVICIRCGNCIKVCPTDIIQSSFDLYDPIGILTPELDFSQSYCLPECSLCGDICPSGAITNFTIDGKKKLFIGTAQIDLNGCLLTQNKECDRCKFYCAYKAIEIINPNGDATAYPRVIADLCVGCGACKIVCPAGIIDIHPLLRPMIC